MAYSVLGTRAEYEKLSHEVIATENDINENLFGNRKYAEVLIAEYENEPAGQERGGD